MASRGEDVAKERELVIDEVRLFWNALVRRGQDLHADESLTMGMRAILEFLLRNGPTTVPNVARRRGVTRQHVQALVNPLLEDGLVEAVENPAHRRSPLMRLSARGESTIRRMRRREAAVLDEADAGLSRTELQRTASALRRIRRALDP